MMMHAHTESSTQGNPSIEHERTDVSIIGVAIAVLIVIVLVTAVLLFMAGMFGALREYRAAGVPDISPFTTQRQPPPPPRLQVDPAADLAELHEYEQNLLRTYRWVDRDKGIVTIPVDRAIDLLLQRDTLNQTGGSDASE